MRLIRLTLALAIMRLANRMAISLAPELEPEANERLQASGLLPRR